MREKHSLLKVVLKIYKNERERRERLRCPLGDNGADGAKAASASNMPCGVFEARALIPERRERPR